MPRARGPGLPVRRSSAASSSPASSRTRARNESAKSRSPRIAASVTAATSGPQPARSASISITSPCTRVESTSITTSRLARRCSPDRSTATSTPRAAAVRASWLAEQHRVGAGHLELDGRDGVVGDPHDPVDVAAVVGDAARDARERGGAQRVPEHRDVAAAAAVRALVGVPGGDLDLHPQRCQRRLQRGPDPCLGTTRGAQQDAEHQPVPDDHLLDVHDGRVQAGQRLEQRRRDPRPVAAGDGHEQRAGRALVPLHDGATLLSRPAGAARTGRQ